MKIFKLSPFVKNQFKQSPELNELMLGDLDLASDWKNYQRQYSHLDVFALTRKYRQTRLALIATKDLENSSPENHIKTLKQTSQLAKLMIEFACEVATQELAQKFGNVINSKGEKQSFIVFALGKLGGNELNYSSDVDLVFCYSGGGQSDGLPDSNRCLDAHSYFQQLGRRIIQLLDSTTQDGIVYRVDMRLRPFGSAAPLVCSVTNLQDYLETEGRDWERYAWLRASFVVGDQVLAATTLEAIQPFIYRKYLDYNIFASLRQIKAQIIRQQADDLDNLKLGLGGIREIEFIVQTLQLTFAGRNKQLRGNDLWLQMHNLQAFKHIGVKECQQLTGAWLFLRKLENFCQIIHDKDQHHLPDDPTQIALCMGIGNSEQLNQQLKTHRLNVHAIFDNLFISNQNTQNENISHPEIQIIKDEVSKKNFPKATKHKIYAALDVVIPYLETSENQHQLIVRYQQVIDAISKRSSYLSMLIESPVILKKLTQLISHSPYFSTAIAKTPSLLELLFEPLDKNDFDCSYQWQLMTKKYNTDDEEQYLEVLCQFKQHMQFKAIMAYVDQFNGAQITGKILSELAQTILSLVINQALQQIQKTQNIFDKDDLIVIAYGSLAMQNMHLSSDFDIVFILDKSITNANQKTAMRWIKRIIHLLSVQAYSGKLYKLDMQLRPNGQSGAAIVSKSNFENYQLNEAWLWEHAALIKSRVVYANPQQEQWFNHLRRQVLCQQRDPQMVDVELADMAEKLNKLNKSRKASVKNHQKEFAILAKILKQAHHNPPIVNSIKVDLDSFKLKLNQSIEI
ncbi:MAG: hypothetical protein L3J83_02595 [Proteobacteria bacterium]|nr:hypothetical protein [Pseudomonadota bacterium]